MRACIFVILLVAHAFLPSREPCLRALIACDMTSKDIRRGSQADFIRMKKSLTAIARQLKITPKITCLKEKKFTSNNVLKWLKKVPSRSNDVVFFYYSGHGGRLSSFSDPWPFLIFPSKNVKKKPGAIVGGSVYRFLRQKKTRLSIIIFDACNNVFLRKGSELLSSPILPIISTHTPLRGLKKLFLHTKGMITSCAAKPGESAITTVGGAVIGGVFTTGFLYALKNLADNPNVEWNEILSGASTYCRHYHLGMQHPIYSIETS